jgi:hypothetical protein
MDFVSFTLGIGPQFLLFLAAIKFHQRHKLPKLLIIGLTLALIFSLPTAFHLCLGVERVQALLFELFPNANDPNGLTNETSYRIGDIAVGQVYLRFFEISHYIMSIPTFLTGLGVFQYARTEIRLAAPEHPPHFRS